MFARWMLHQGTRPSQKIKLKKNISKKFFFLPFVKSFGKKFITTQNSLSPFFLSPFPKNFPKPTKILKMPKIPDDVIKATNLVQESESDLKSKKGTSFFITLNFEQEGKFPQVLDKNELDSMKEIVSEILGGPLQLGKGGYPKYWVACMERGKEKNTPHWHVFVQYDGNHQKTWQTMKKKWNDHGYLPNIQFARKAGVACVTYVKKDENWVEAGSPPEAGKRNDLEEMARKIIAGANLRDIAIEYPTQALRYGRQMQAYQSLVAQNYHGPREVTWYEGPAGAGKSYRARQDMYEIVRREVPGGKDFTNEQCDEHIYYHSGNTAWFGGYYGQKFAIFDEWRSPAGDDKAIPFHKMLSLLGNDPGAKVCPKGSEIHWNARWIHITSIETWEESVPMRENDASNQLSRRILKIKKFSKPRQVVVRAPIIEEVAAYDPDAPPVIENEEELFAILDDAYRKRAAPEEEEEEDDEPQNKSARREEEEGRQSDNEVVELEYPVFIVPSFSNDE